MTLDEAKQLSYGDIVYYEIVGKRRFGKFTKLVERQYGTDAIWAYWSRHNEARDYYIDCEGWMSVNSVYLEESFKKISLIETMVEYEGLFE
jgi:hypothetical protein